MSNLVTWPDLIRDACWLWLRIEASKQDLQTVYAVDSSVAFLYAEPRKNSFHAQMLGFVDNETLPDLSYILGEMSLRRAETSGGFILLPGQDMEFLRIFKKIQERRLKELGRGTSVKLADRFSDPPIASDVKRIDARVQNESTADIARFIGGEFEILHGIVRDQRFILSRWYEFVSRGRLKAFGDVEIVLPKPQSSDEKFIDLESSWFDAIRTEKSVYKTAIAIEDDAQALATLGWTNAELERLGSKRRVVMLTLDESLQTAAFKQPDLPGASAIRDPRQFVRDLPSTIGPFVASDTPSEARSYGVQDWLSVLLAPFATDGKLSFENVRKVAIVPVEDESWREIVALFENHHGDRENIRLRTAQAEWSRFVRLGINRYAVGHMHVDPRLQRIAEVIKSQKVEGLEQALTEYVVETTSNASVSSIVAGLYISLGTASIGEKSDHRFFRMPIAIRSQNAETREEYIRFMDQAVREKNLDKVRPFLKFTEKYRVHLYYGVYFAAMGNWEATETLADAALGFAQAQMKDEDISGAEAAYLLAVASRHRVKKPDDLARAERNLRYAEEAREKSRGDHQDVRLVLERVALNLMRSFSLLLLGELWRSHNTHLMQPSDMLTRLQFANTLLAGESDKLFVQMVRKQLLGNILALGMFEFLRDDGRIGKICHLPEFKQAVDELDDLQNILRRGSPLEQAAQSHYLEILVRFGRWIGSGAARPQETAKLKEMLRSAASDLIEMPYDSAKYLRLAQLVR